MTKDFKITHGGLREKTDDDRDFNLGAVFGTIDIKEVPNEDFECSSPLAIKDQGDTDYCSAYAVTSVSEDQEGIELSPEYQFFTTKRITGNLEEWGADLRSACKSAVKYGSVPASEFPEMKGKPRNYILNSANWPDKADFMASLYKKATYFAVNNRYDIFDNIRTALWQHRKDKSTIVTGASWKSAWIGAQNGIIPEVTGDGFGHAFKVYGQKIIGGVPYLKAQLSNGVNVGDKGIYYFSREVVNAEFGKFGIFMFKDISREEAEEIAEKPYVVNTHWILKLFWDFIRLFKK